MKTLAKKMVVLGGAVVSFSSVYHLLSGTQIWRWRMSRMLDAQLRAMMKDRSQDRIDMATNACYVEHLGLYANWESSGHDTTHPLDYFYTVTVPKLIEYEHRRQIFDLIADRFLAIGNYKKYGHYHVQAEWLATAIDEACRDSKHRGFPLDNLLQSLRV